ncbi:TlpA disulfide reductase family protein [Pedobacter ghigonis]|uniref:TlpA disulfide reductase family protein n=1 Tax=Pedobacter ghigonis TaxID=2730403 RepID=UPI00158F5B08|nr:TlpA disulfide reductase family protein [Pedobacter ghigonis]
MRLLLYCLLLVLTQKAYSQTNIYTFNTHKFFTEAEIRSTFNKISKGLPADLDITPTVYHKITKKDTVINYLRFDAHKTTEKSAFALLYKQDSTFLLLDKKIPPFVLKDLDGKVFTSTQFLGKPTLINFWAIYCGPCIAEMPALSKLKEKYGSEMNFISITENDATRDALKQFVKNKEFNFLVLANGQEYQKNLKITALPRNLFIDKNGILRYIEGNFPLEGNEKEQSAESNSFIKIINSLINEAK